MKVKSKERKTITLTLTGKEARLLAGLADFPDWDAQKPEVAAFLSMLHEGLTEATGYHVTVVDAGYVDSTSFEIHI